MRGVSAQGELGYRAHIVVAPNSALKSIDDLRSKRIAFGSPTSTQGHWIPRIMFDTAGLKLADFDSHLYTGSHRACAEAVIAGQADACGMQDTLAKRLVESGALRTLAVSEVFPSSGIFVHAAVPEAVRRGYREAPSRM